jgi:DNA modification methylase
VSDVYRKNKVYQCDYRELAAAIPDQSVDLIVCDPDWSKIEGLADLAQIEQYADLAEIGKRILKPYGLCIAQVGTLYLWEAMKAMARHLDYYWVISEEMHQRLGFHARRMWQLHKPHIIFANGVKNCPKRRFMPDRVHSQKNKSAHPWQDGEGTFHCMVDILTEPGQTVADFFACTGTVPVVCRRLGRDFWACDIDGKSVEYANQRLAETQVNIIQPVYIQLDILQMQLMMGEGAAA